MKLKITSTQRTTLGNRRTGTVTLMAGRAVQIEETRLPELLEAGKGFGHKLLDAGVLRIEEPRRERAERVTSPEPLAPKGAPSPDTPPMTLHHLSVREAEPLIAAETDVERLELWAEADERKGVHDAVADRLAALELQDEDDSKGDPEG